MSSHTYKVKAACHNKGASTKPGTGLMHSRTYRCVSESGISNVFERSRRCRHTLAGGMMYTCLFS
eukprot:7516524-Pyramimonas_sp.AAC.1